MKKKWDKVSCYCDKCLYKNGTKFRLIVINAYICKQKLL